MQVGQRHPQGAAQARRVEHGHETVELEQTLVLAQTIDLVLWPTGSREILIFGVDRGDVPFDDRQRHGRRR
ncbi:MAG TPA: hypothetical protein VF886_10860 [Roseiarcus sp.]